MLVLQRFPEYGAGIQNQHNTAIPQQRSSGQGLVLDPFGIQGLDYQFLFPYQRIGGNPKPAAARGYDDDKEVFSRSSQGRSFSTDSPVKAEDPSGAHHRQEPVPQPKALEIVEVDHFLFLDSCYLADHEQGKRKSLAA